jgi:hypothetical protein
MNDYAVTLESGRMLLVSAPSANLAKAAAYREAVRLGMAPNVKHVAPVSAETAAIVRAGNTARVAER